MKNLIDCELYSKKKVKIDTSDAFIVVDMQNDFMPSGSLPIEDGNLIVNDINILMEFLRKKKLKLL